MNLKQILDINDKNNYHQILAKYDVYYQQRIDMLKTAKELFQSKKKITEMTNAERRVFLGRNTHEEVDYEFDTNLFGAPGGNGEVLRIVSSQYPHLDDFFAAIPRDGDITHSQFNELVDLFRLGCQNGGAKKFAFVFLTRILAVTRPDFFLSSAAKALDVICLAVGCKKVGTDPEKYWQLLTQYIHKTPLYYQTKQMVGNFDVALLDGVVSNDTDLSKYEESSIASPQADYANELNSKKQINMNNPLNQILYGPPGTGKTYHTIEAAVKAAEPKFTWDNRAELKQEYERLVSDKRIRFVTFHQSYGYEEFVEGLRAESDIDGNLSYPIKDGVFKSICDEASAQKVVKPELLSEDARIWQLSIESSGYSKVKQFCLDNDLGAIGWGHVGDMTPTQRTQEIDDVLVSETHPNQATIRHFCNGMAIGDVVFCVSGQKTIEAIGVVSGDYEFRPDGVSVREDYCHVRPIKWLVKDLALNVYDLNCQTRLPIKTCSELTRFSIPELLTLLNKKNILLNKDVAQDMQRFVLVIDEINRGNISKIFGELITLIEPSKRAGQEEALELVLPYSGKAFSVPDNVHIIGTMNTADRSLAMMDTALRRRFDFVEMMPKPELLQKKIVKGIDLTKLLATLNRRIEVLYDREHTLGHAFLFPSFNAQVDEDAFNALQSAFKNKIIPLLEEYFYDDWNKIRLVLGDNQKSDALCFIEKHTDSYESLFGSEHGLETYEESKTSYTLKSFDGGDSVWNNPQAYIAIYTPSK